MAASEERVYAPGEVIVGAGQEPDKVFVVVEGSARVVYHGGAQPAPRWAVVDILGVGSLYGLVPALDGEPHVSQLEAVTGVKVLSASREAFLRELNHHPEVTRDLLLQLARYVRNTERWLTSTL